ncbi:TPA: transporter substrate-binding domain-containing protein, partial [Haemophilus influenzae]
MKGLFLRIITALALLFWAIDMVFPWQFLRHTEENHYTAIQARGSLYVGTINNQISYFINKDSERGFEYELAKAFADTLGVELEMKIFDNQEQLFDELDKHNIDLAAAHLLYHPKNAERFQIGPAYHSASWQLAYRKNENRPKNLGNVKKDIYISNNLALEET